MPAKAKTIQSRPPEICARGLFRGVEGEAEQQQDHQRERERGVDRFLGAQLGAQILGGDGEALTDEAQSRAPDDGADCDSPYCG